MSLFCRHNRYTTDCPICSKEALPAQPARPAPAREATASKGKKKAPAGARKVSGQYGAAGPYEDLEVSRYEVRLERVPGGLRLAEWVLATGELRRRAPVLEAADLPGLVERAIEKGVVADAEAEKLADAVAAEQGSGVSRGRSGRVLGGAAGGAAGGRPGAGSPLDRAARQRLGAPGDAGDAAGGAIRRGLRGRGVRCISTGTTLSRDSLHHGPCP